MGHTTTTTTIPSGRLDGPIAPARPVAPPPDADPIEMVEVILDGKKVYVPATAVRDVKEVVVAPNGSASIPSAPEATFGGSVVPSDRMAGRRPTATIDELTSVFENIAAAEAGRAHLPVRVTPDGTMEVRKSGGTTAVSAVPTERFAAAPSKEATEVRRVDPEDRHWRWVEQANVKGWFVTLRNVWNDHFTFFVSSAPVGLYEAQLVKPNLDAYMGHLHHMLDQGRICLNDRWGVASLVEMHGALAKFCLYTGAICRGIDPKFSR